MIQDQDAPDMWGLYDCDIRVAIPIIIIVVIAAYFSASKSDGGFKLMWRYVI